MIDPSYGLKNRKSAPDISLHLWVSVDEISRFRDSRSDDFDRGDRRGDGVWKERFTWLTDRSDSSLGLSVVESDRDRGDDRGVAIASDDGMPGDPNPASQTVLAKDGDSPRNREFDRVRRRNRRPDVAYDLISCAL